MKKLAQNPLQWIVPPVLFCTGVLCFLLLQDHTDLLRLVLEITLTAGLSLSIFWLLLRPWSSARSEIPPFESGVSPNAVQQSSHRLDSFSRNLFDSVSDGVLILDPSNRIVAANEATRSKFGHTSATFVGQSFRDLFPGNGRDVFDEIIEQMEDTGRAQVESDGRRLDGTTFHAALRGGKIAYLGRPALLITVDDVTEQSLLAEQQVLLSRKIMVAQEEERTRISRDLHDGLGQLIAAVHFELGAIRKRLTGRPGVSNDEFAGADSLIEEAGEKLRRICRGLRPPVLDDLGLLPSVRQLVDEFEEYSPLEIDLQIRLDEDRFPISPEVALCVFRVLQEALTNVTRHANAQTVDVTLVREYQWLVLSVYDNGRGFDERELESVGGFGIAGMRERAKLVKGTFEIKSVRDQGTRLVLRIPVPRQTQEEAP